jgi:thioredoxin reductase
MADGGVAIVGGGPAGLAAAIALRERGVGEVVVIEREAEPGGIPRHARHQGFGLRDLRRPLSGPAYARRYAELARAAGAELLLETMVTGWAEPGVLELTGPGGRSTLRPAAVVLATGCRERPRSARLVPGSRPEGVMTTGMLQQLVYLQGLPAGRRALVVGAEHVSFSAIMTLAHGGARAVALTTELDRHQSVAAFRLGALARYRVPVWTRTRVSAIRGRPRVEEVELTDLDRGGTRTVACDTVVFTADWIPDHELAVMANLELDPLTRGPAVDAALRTSVPGVFAAGNLLHGAEQADVAALSGRHAAAAVARYLEDRSWPSRRVPIVCEPPLGWIAPNAISGADAPPRGRFALRASRFVVGRRASARVHVTQDGRTLWSGRVARLMPGRSARLPYDWVRDADTDGEPVVCTLRHPG